MARSSKYNSSVKGKKTDTGIKTIARNRRASFDYERLETFEAGIELTGTEVRSLREGGGQLTDTFALIRSGEIWLLGLHIKPYSHGNRANTDPDRRRRLLLHKKEIRYLSEKVAQAGLTLVPFSIYFKENSLVKVELVLARGKKTYDKRATIAERDSKREIDRAIKNRSAL
jgi:SsrA-binding protein